MTVDWDKIRKILDRNLEVYETKKPDVNAERYAKKREVIGWTIAELREGPLKHGTHENSGIWACDYWEGLKQCILERDENRCQICGGQGKLLEVHHIMPRHLGGHDHPRNLITLCDACHDEVHRVISRSIEKGIEESMNRAKIKFGEYTDKSTTLDMWVRE